jgi:hypothetical protein
MDLARLAAPTADIRLLEEATGYNPFVSITRA